MIKENVKFFQKSVATLLLIGVGCAHANSAEQSRSDIAVPDVMMVSSKATELMGAGIPQNVTGLVTSDDKIVLYHSIIRVINPTNKTYSVDVECVDSEGNLIIRSSSKREALDITEMELFGGKTRFFSIDLALNPAEGAMVAGQKQSLQHGKSYFFRLSLNGVLVGMTHFDYVKLEKKRKK